MHEDAILPTCGRLTRPSKTALTRASRAQPWRLSRKLVYTRGGERRNGALRIRNFSSKVGTGVIPAVSGYQSTTERAYPWLGNPRSSNRSDNGRNP